ncbi:MAG: STAS domain-containing protein [Bacteroidetes bacterium]|nr:STAS domain-containing protein [Bacteroidota bacterium]
MSLNITWEFQDNIRTSILHGRIDSRNASLFHKTVETELKDQDQALILDFTRVDYISSAGLRVVLQLAKLYRGDRKFAVCGLVPTVKEIFEISGFNQIIQIYDSLDNAKEEIA